jgi:hypothetical protein
MAQLNGEELSSPEKTNCPLTAGSNDKTLLIQHLLTVKVNIVPNNKGNLPYTN